ncbi:hypothetical protein J2X29_000486 [Shewanella putrefaciens]|nr:hypothetical protein [Shewanella putrefaciens]
MACRWRHNDNKLPELINGYLALVQFLLIQRHNFYGVVKDDCILTCLAFYVYIAKLVVKIGIGSPVSVGDMDVAVEPIRTYSWRVAGDTMTINSLN